MQRRFVLPCTLSLVTALVTAPLSAQTPPPKPPQKSTAASTDRSVTVTYKGKGVVDAKHDILVFAFDHPNPAADSRPLGLQYVTKNGGTATFSGLSDPVYFFVLYDEQGDYDGRSGPPPTGTPIAMYSSPKGEPLTVKPGAKVKVVFDGSKKWK